jgi:FtsP/CotA-like multicopper oxidase with cupredoxin domain
VPALALTPALPAPSSSGSLAPANRVDLLVQAPSVPGTYKVTFTGRNTVLFTVEVKQDPNAPVIANPMPFPTTAQFPKMPGFLTDIDPGKVLVRRELHFASVADPTSGKPASNRGTKPPFAAPKHTINGKQFDSHIDQAMLLGATEEWTLYNDSAGAAHPFHIHINPFQVIEILNPAISKNPVKLPGPWIWWDNFAIPPAAVPPDSTDGKLVSGYFKMLTRFVDYTGMYVLHCHILGHEDRGMMQLVEVVTNTTTMQHK